MAWASEKFARFINTLTLEAHHASHVRRLTLEIDDSRPIRIPKTNETILDVPLGSVQHAFSRMHRLEYLDLQPPFSFSNPFVSSLCQALSGHPIRALRSQAHVGSRNIFQECKIWASSITDLVLEGSPHLSDIEAYSEKLGPLPRLRFIAGANISLISSYIRSSPVESICLTGGYASESKLAGLVTSISTQGSAGASTLRSIYMKQLVHPKQVLWNFLNLLACPTLEHMHFVLDGKQWSEPHSMTDYVAACLEAASPSMPHALPALKSLRFELYDCKLRNTPLRISQPERASPNLKTEAGSRLLIWLQHEYHPPLLQTIQVYTMGASSDDSIGGYRIASVEAVRPLGLPGAAIESPRANGWEVTDSVEDIFLPLPWRILTRGFDPPAVVSDRAALPIVADADGVIRYVAKDTSLTTTDESSILSPFPRLVAQVVKASIIYIA